MGLCNGRHDSMKNCLTITLLRCEVPLVRYLPKANPRTSFSSVMIMGSILDWIRSGGMRWYTFLVAKRYRSTLKRRVGAVVIL